MPDALTSRLGRTLAAEDVRPHFPGLDTPWALFDNAGGSLACKQVIAHLRGQMEERCVQLGGSYALSVEADRAVEAGRAAAAALLGATPETVALGPSSTELVHRLAQALRPLLRPGDEVVVTAVDHETNVGAWRALEEFGVVLRTWPFRPDTIALDVADLEPLLNERTRVVAFTNCSNIVGTIHDVAGIAARVRAAGAWSVVDGVAFAPHRRVDVAALGVDVYFASLYKIFGPHLGCMYVRAELLEQLRSQNHFFTGQEGPQKLERGGLIYELVAALAGIPEYLTAIAGDGGGDPLTRAFERIAATETALVTPLLEFLERHPATRVIGSTDPDPTRRVPTVSFVVEGRSSSEIPAALDRDHVAARFGHFYAHRLIEALGLHDRDGVVRVSLLHYNTPEEVARLLAALERALS